MSRSKSRQPITYANNLPRHKKASTKKQFGPSPKTARTAFNLSNKNNSPNTGKTKREALAPRAEPKLQPKGMGEYGVNWNAHAARLQKAKKAVRMNRTASKAFARSKPDPMQGR